MTADLIARELEARRSGPAWMANCPAHDDHNPSLSIRPGRRRIPTVEPALASQSYDDAGCAGV
jgi:hypothetical protein